MVQVKKTNRPIDQANIKKVRHAIRKISEKGGREKRASGFVESVLRFTITAGIFGFLSFMAINYPAFAKQLKWAYYVDYLGKNLPEAKAVLSATPTPSPSPTPKPKPTATIDNLLPPESLPEIPIAQGNFIKIEKITVNAPIVWDVSEQDILDNLKNGVVHYKGTSRPGEGGNVFIVGHSSNYFWIKSDYNQIFALLDKLVNGDRIEIRKGTQSYFYDVTEKKVVSPKQVEVLNSLNKETLTLMTCWPVGTNLNRLVVQAELKLID